MYPTLECYLSAGSITDFIVKRHILKKQAYITVSFVKAKFYFPVDFEFFRRTNRSDMVPVIACIT